MTKFDDGTSTAGRAEDIVAKQRNGPVGNARIAFEARFAAFADLNGEAQQKALPPP